MIGIGGSPAVLSRSPVAAGRWLLSGCVLGCLLLVNGTARADSTYLQSLQARAAAMALAQTRGWHALLHYEANWLWPGVTSTVATPWFFRATNGRTDPSAELRASLAAMFETDDVANRKAPARCVFPARYAFLDRHLGFDGARMPDIDCQRYRKWRKGLEAASVSLVFPSAYTNNPSSMFGHTLLRIDAGSADASRELLAYAVNFAANTRDEAGIRFAFKGLTGGYAGAYGVFPYYEKVKEYAWIENRDLWSYPLDFSASELDRLMAHLWEMQGVTFDYYFFTKNCSYQLLALLQAARPQLRLTEAFDWYAIPADTIRRLARVPGMLGEPQYRPALATRLARHAAALTDAQRALALAVAAGRTPPDAAALAELDATDRARVLEVAHDDRYYRNQTSDTPNEAAAARAERILLARSRISADSGLPSVAEPATAPDQGHDTLRLAGGGVWEGDTFSLGLRLRPAYHDLLDPPGGYTAGARINALDVSLRADRETDTLELDRLTLLDITSISARDALFKPISWRIRTGLRQRPVSAPLDDDAHLGYYLAGGPGLAWGDLDSLTAYTFALASTDINHGFDHGYAVAAGGSAGLLAYPLPGWQLRAEFGAVDYVAGDHGRRAWVDVTQQWPLAPGVALRAGIGYRNTARRDYGLGSLTLQAYF